MFSKTQTRKMPGRKRKNNDNDSSTSKTTPTNTTTQNDSNKKFKALKCVAPRTEQGYDSAEAAFDDFAKQQNIAMLKDLTAEFLEEYTMQLLLEEFSTFLLEDTNKIGTALQYLSGVKSYFIKKFPDLSCWSVRFVRHGKFEWYTTIRKNLKKKAVQKANETGKPLRTKPDAIRKTMLRSICKVLLNMNSEAAVITCTVMVILWSAIGRACELAMATWNSMTFDGRELDFMWVQKKTARESPMRFPADRFCFITCPFHAIARYLICFKGCFVILNDPKISDDVRFLFPRLVNKSEGAIAASLTAELGRLKKTNKVPCLEEMPKIKGFRNGAVMHLRFDSRLSGKMEANVRGGWAQKESKDEIGSEYEYVEEQENVSRAGKYYYTLDLILYRLNVLINISFILLLFFRVIDG